MLIVSREYSERDRCFRIRQIDPVPVLVYFEWLFPRNIRLSESRVSSRQAVCRIVFGIPTMKKHVFSCCRCSGLESLAQSNFILTARERLQPENLPSVAKGQKRDCCLSHRVQRKFFCRFCVTVIFPDSRGSFVDVFHDQCARHDLCYRHGYYTYYLTKDDCDDEFAEDLGLQCGNFYQEMVPGVSEWPGC